MAEKSLQFRSQKIADPEDGEPPAAAHRDLLPEHHRQEVTQGPFTLAISFCDFAQKVV